MVHHGGGFLIIYLQVHESMYHGKSQSGVVCHGGKVCLVAEYLIQNRTEIRMLHRLLYLFWILALVSASADDGPGDAEFK